MKMKAYIFLIFLIPACVNAIYNCEVQPKCFIWEGHNKLVSNEKELTQKCNEYNNLVKCIDEYGKECIGDSFSSIRPSLFQAYGNVAKMCTDENFRREYLQESGNFASFQDEYNKCIGDATMNQKQSESIAAQAREMCCRLDVFKDCVQDMCKDCPPNAAKIFKGLVASEYSAVPSCPQEILKDCPKNSSAKISFNMIYLAILMMFYALIR